MDLSLLFPKAQGEPILSSVIEGAPADGVNGKFLTLEGKTAGILKQTRPGQSLGIVHKQLYGRRAYYVFSRIDPERTATTIIKGSSGGLFHFSEDRTLTIGEYKRLGAFPDDFRFVGGFSSGIQLIGNSVPPLFMQAIALQIRHIMFGGQALRSYPEDMDYLEILNQAWQQHLAPREPDAPTVVSTFAGCGGSSLGYSMAGFRELLAVDWDENAVETFKLNFPGVPVYCGDIHNLTVERCLKITGLKPGELDLLDGSPPCQGFSLAGKRQLDDERNQLAVEFVRLLRGLRPKVFVMENVSGMVKGKMKLLFAEIMQELKASGYQVSARVMNAMYFYVPQSRERLIFIGVRDDLGIEARHPKPESEPITAGDAVEGVESRTFRSPLVGVARRIWETARPGQRGRDLDWSGGYYFNTVKADPKRPVPTVPKTIAGTGTILHWSEPRCLSIEEIKRLQSFPDPFVFVGTFGKAWERIGNSVPPLFMRAIAGCVRQHILSPCFPNGVEPMTS